MSLEISGCRKAILFWVRRSRNLKFRGVYRCDVKMEFIYALESHFEIPNDYDGIHDQQMNKTIYISKLCKRSHFFCVFESICPALGVFVFFHLGDEGPSGQREPGGSRGSRVSFLCGKHRQKIWRLTILPPENKSAAPEKWELEDYLFFLNGPFSGDFFWGGILRYLKILAMKTTEALQASFMGALRWNILPFGVLGVWSNIKQHTNTYTLEEWRWIPKKIRYLKGVVYHGIYVCKKSEDAYKSYT